MNKPLKEQLKRIGGMKLNEAFEIEDVQDYEARVFDAIAEFKKVFEKSEFKKSGHGRKVNSIIKQMLKLEQQLSDVTQEL